MNSSSLDDVLTGALKRSLLGVTSLWVLSLSAGLACNTGGDTSASDSPAGTGTGTSGGGLAATGDTGGLPSAASSAVVAAPDDATGNPATGVPGSASGGSAAGSVGSMGESTGTAGDPGGSVDGDGNGAEGDGVDGDGAGGTDGNGTEGNAGTGGVAGTGGGGAESNSDATDSDPATDVSDSVTRAASTFTFQHFPIETNSDDVWAGAMSPGQQPTSTTFDTVILENGSLRVTLLPDYGGRVLSIVHKPTDTELLYQNPLGTPYLMYEEIFYYDYLVIMGGLFPSFPEPEHGRYWNQPYDFEVVSESEEAITVRMSRQDDRDVAEGVPAAYSVGRTDVLVEVDVTLRAGSSSLELNTTLTNTRSSAVPEFEYWTVTTLAPGSVPGATAIPLNTRIVADMDRVHLLESSWSWFGDAEERVSDEVFNWNNLSYFENWVDQGTAFANPEYRANWSGLINYDNDIGILRVSDNVETPGLKLWTFGRDSLGIDINDSSEWLRPTIEMWHGVTPEFWNRGSMAANEVRQWSESYFPTFGLREITAASEYGALYLPPPSTSAAGAESVLTAAATLTLPGQTVKALLRLDGTVIAEQDVVVLATEATTVSATVASSEIAPGAVFEAEFIQGDNRLLSGQVTLQ